MQENVERLKSFFSIWSLQHAILHSRRVLQVNIHQLSMPAVACTFNSDVNTQQFVCNGRTRCINPVIFLVDVNNKLSVHMQLGEEVSVFDALLWVTFSLNRFSMFQF